MNIIKVTLLTFILTAIVLNLNARSFPKDTLRGKNASYQREFIFTSIIARNIQNKDTIPSMYFDDGKQVPEGYWPQSKPKFKTEDVMKIYKDFFTPQELDQQKTSGGEFAIYVVLDKNGNIIEMEFSFSKNNPVLSKFSADRLFEIETKYKKSLKWDLIGNDRKIKRLRLMLAIKISDAIQS